MNSYHRAALSADMIAVQEFIWPVAATEGPAVLSTPAQATVPAIEIKTPVSYTAPAPVYRPQVDPPKETVIMNPDYSLAPIQTMPVQTQGGATLAPGCPVCPKSSPTPWLIALLAGYWVGKSMGKR